MKKFVLLLSILSLFFISCESEITLEQKKDGSVKVDFSETAGDAIADLLKLALGSETVVFDVNEIILGLNENKFSETKAHSVFGTDLVIETNVVDKSNFLFSSGILKSNGKNLSVSISEKNLIQFYNESDDLIKAFLDLFFAPVFYGEKMTLDEYLEGVSAVYGEAFANELKKSSILIKTIGLDGNKKEQRIPLVEFLTLDKEITF